MLFSCFLGGPYGVFAGRDASRGLATFSLGEESIKDEYDDLSDLNTMQMDSVKEWEMQFTGKILRLRYMQWCYNIGHACCSEGTRLQYSPTHLGDRAKEDLRHHSFSRVSH